MNITKEEFLAFEDVRQSGATNMWDAFAVEDLSDGIVTKDIHRYIISGNNYQELAHKFLKEMFLPDEDWSTFGA